MAQFSVNAQRFDPYKNFKFRVKWDGRIRRWPASARSARSSASTEVVEHREGGDPSTSRKSPGRTKYEAITLERGVTHDTEFEKWANKVWNFGSGLGAEVSLKDFRKDVHHRGLQRGRPARARLQGLSLLGVGVPGAARPRRQRQRGRDPAHQARERGLGARLRGARAGRADASPNHPSIGHACRRCRRAGRLGDAGAVGRGARAIRSTARRCSPARARPDLAPDASLTSASAIASCCRGRVRRLRSTGLRPPSLPGCGERLELATRRGGLLSRAARRRLVDAHR